MPGSGFRGPGSIFRQARLKREITLLEAQQGTKIRQSFLNALEDDDYSILPPPVYVRGFIKSYSRFLDLDSNKMVQLFDELLANVAAGYEVYPGSYGAGDSGVSSPNPQMLAGLSQGEARLVEKSNEILNLNPLNPSNPDDPFSEGYEFKEQELPQGDPHTFGSADSSGNSRENPSFSALRIPNHYILRPAMQPVWKPSLYMPNFVPFLLVLIIVGAAFLLVYRGLAVPATKDLSDLPTATPNVYSKATVTPFSNSDPGVIARITGKPSEISLADTRPPFFTPDPVLSNPSKTPDPSSPTTTGSAANPGPSGVATKAATGSSPGPATTAVLNPATAAVPTTALSPTPAGDTLKVIITASNGPSWLSVIVDGQEKYGKVLPVGQSFSVEGKRIAVRAGAPGAIRVRINGQDKVYAPPASDIITHTWDVNGEDTITK